MCGQNSRYLLFFYDVPINIIGKYDMKSDYVRMWAISKEGSIVYPPIPIVMTLKINYVTIVYFLD